MLISKQLTFYPPKSDENRKKQALWHCFLKQFDVSQLGYFAINLNYDMDAFFNIESWKDVYLLKHDNANLSTFVLNSPLFPNIPCSLLDSSVFLPYVKFEDTYRKLSIHLAPVFVIGPPKFQDWVAISIKS